MKTTFGAIGGVALLAILALSAGCQAKRPVPAQVDVRLTDQEAYHQFWLHAIRSVRHFGYDLDRADPAAGVITTQPLTSKQWFEFWRNDTLSVEQVVEASLHTIRRQVRLEVQPTTQGGEYQVDAIVNVERQERLQTQITVPSNVLQAFNPRSTVRGEVEQSVHWVSLGRDPVLEQAILRQVARWPDAEVVVPADEAPAEDVRP